MNLPSHVVLKYYTGSSLDPHHRCHSVVCWPIHHSLYHRLKILLGRRFASPFFGSSHSPCRYIHSRLPVLGSDRKNRSEERTRSTPYGSLLSHLPATQSSRYLAGLLGLMDSKGDILNLLPTPLRSVQHFYTSVVGGSCLQLRLFLGMHRQHVYHLRICERPV